MTSHIQPSTNNLPLKGIVVLDVASFIAAPVAATILGDYGADVIKVEPPGEGDSNRHIMRLAATYPKADVNYPWEMDSRGKRSIAIDLKTPAGREAFDALVAVADVLITNYPLDVRARLKLDYKDVAQLNPRLVYAAFTGYGEHGPDASQLGFDVNAYFARSGILDGARYEGAYPGVAMPAAGDRPSGVTLALGIMMALWQRNQTGSGTRVTSSLLANGLWANGVNAQAALVGATLPPRPPPDRPRSALANVYQTKDERWLQLSLIREDRHWPSLLQVLDRKDWASEPLFADMAARRTNAAQLAGAISDVILTRTYVYWSEALKSESIPFAGINRAGDIPDDAQAVACGAVVKTNNPEMPLTLAAPFAVDGMAVPAAEPAPELGQHTDEILRGLGFSQDKIAELREKGGIA